jgi:hypothetical protein
MQFGRDPFPVGVVQENCRNHNILITAFAFQQLEGKPGGNISMNIVVAGIKKGF